MPDVLSTLCYGKILVEICDVGKFCGDGRGRTVTELITVADRAICKNDCEGPPYKVIDFAFGGQNQFIFACRA